MNNDASQGSYVISQWVSRFGPNFSQPAARRIDKGFGQSQVRKGVWIDPPIIADKILDVRKTLPSPSRPVRAVVIEETTTAGGGTILPGTSAEEKVPVFTVVGSGPWLVSVQVQNSSGLALTGRYWIRFSLGDTEWAADSVSGVLTVTSATYSTSPADQVYDVVTNSDGTCVLSVTATANQYLMGAVGLEKIYSTGVLTYTPAASHPVSLITRLTPLGLPGRRCGSFAGR